MTADVELLPSSVAAFTEALRGERGSLDAWLEVNDEREVRAHVEAYARACVAHATAELHRQFGCELQDPNGTIWDHAAKLQAEVEALRAEVNMLRGKVDEAVVELLCRKARAEQLTEALRVLLGCVDDLTAYDNEDDEIGYRPCCHVLSYKQHSDDCEVAIARAALEQENDDA